MQENTVNRNIIAIKDHSEKTRSELRDLELIIKGFENTVRTLYNEMDVLKTQVQILQIKLFTGGSTS